MINPEAEGFDEQLETAEAAGAAAPRRGKGRIVILLVLLTALGAGGWFAWQTLMVKEPVDGTIAGEERPGSRSNANYLPLDPPLVVNFAAGGQLRYLQVSVEIMARDVRAIESMGRHAPAVRNALIALFSERDYEALLTRAGKETLRQEALDVVRAELSMLTGQPQAEDIYFTSFVMQ